MPVFKRSIMLLLVFVAGLSIGVLASKLSPVIFLSKKDYVQEESRLSFSELQSRGRLLGAGPIKPNQYSSNQLSQINSALADIDTRIKIFTFNILFDLYDKNTPKEHRWPQRLPRVIKILNSSDADIIGLQEPQVAQLKNIADNLNNNYHIESISQEMKKFDTNNNFADAILFKKNRFLLRDKRIIFASETPEVPSKHEKARFPTVSQVIKLWDKKSQKEFVFINTHFDFFSPDVRELTVNNICSFINNKYKNLPVILGGDLNLFPAWPRRKMPYHDGEYLIRLFERKCNLTDARKISLLGHIGPISSYTNSSQYPKQAFRGLGIAGVMLDRILVNNNIQVLVHGVNTKRFYKNSLFASDHLPVYAVVKLR